MDLKVISQEINELLTQRRDKLGLYFIEEDHKYFMKDIKGKLKNDFPSVSTVLKKFYTPFDAMSKSLDMCNGNQHEAQILRKTWAETGEYASNMGSRVHFILEQELVDRNGGYKQVREPIFVVDDEQTRKGDDMITAGKKYLDLMESRGAVLLDTEIVLGDNEFGYTGQPDKVWLMFNKDKSDFGIVITDWKGLPLNTPILTQNGWKTMGTLDGEDKVFDKDGNLVKIKHFSKIKNVKCLKIKFDTGEEIVSDFEHRWLVYTIHNGKKTEKVMTTQEIMDYYSGKKLKPYEILRIENSKPLILPTKHLPIDPYVLGVWLGDGHSADNKITQMNDKVWDEIKRRGYEVGMDVKGKNSLSKSTTRTIHGIRGKLTELNLIKNKHLPEIYLLSSYEQRLDLLRGLMDADGYYNKKRKRFSISTTRLNQIDFCQEIISSLGLKPTIIKYTKRLNNKKIQCYNVEYSTDKFNPFLNRNQDINVIYEKDRRLYRRIVSVEDVESVPTKCIEVDSESHTFLFGKTLIVTHNTNKPKNFEVQPYTVQMLPPFQDYPDTALSHYFCQLPLYGKLLLKMLQGTKYENIKMMGGIVTLLKDGGDFVEYRIPSYFVNTIMDMDIKKILNND